MEGSRWRSTSSGDASGSSSFSRPVVRWRSSQAQASSLRAKMPRFASPPLSPERVPKSVPSGAGRVGPPGASAEGPGAAETSTSPWGIRELTSRRSPEGSTTSCGTTSEGTFAGS